MIQAVLTAFALAVPMLATSASAAEWAHDQAQADTCQKTLELLTDGKIDEAVDTIFLEAQPWNGEAAKARGIPKDG